MRFDNCFCHQLDLRAEPGRRSSPGKYTHINGVPTSSTASTAASRPPQVAAGGRLPDRHGRQVAPAGSDPTGFDHWNILPGQGVYHNPAFIEMGSASKHTGYCTDIITDLVARVAQEARPEGQAVLPDVPPQGPAPPLGAGREAHADLYDDVTGPRAGDLRRRLRQPRRRGAPRRRCAIDRDLTARRPQGDAAAGAVAGRAQDVEVPALHARTTCAASPRVDDNVGRLLDYLDAERPARRTPSSSTPRTRASSSATTAGSTSASCTRSRCGCPSWSASPATIKPGTIERRASS